MQTIWTSAAASRQTPRPRILTALAASLLVLASCGGGGGDAETKGTVAASTTAATTTTTEVTVEEAGEAFQALVEEVQEAIVEEDADRDSFADEADIEGAAESAAGLQEDLEDFRTELVDLEVPKNAEAAVEEVEEATKAYIEVLAGYEDVADIPEYNDQYDEEIAADSEWRSAVAGAAEALEVDGLEGVDPDESSADDADTTEPESDSEPSAGPITGDGSEYCLQDGDLPDAFLPLTGQDNMSNALSFTFDKGHVADYADALVASWLVLPEGGAGPDDLTADCLIHIFESPEASEGFYDAWTADYGSGSSPVPQLAVVADDAPGENPQAYTTIVDDEPNAEQVFRYANVVVSVGVSGTVKNDMEATLSAVNGLAKLVHGRLKSAG